MANNKQQVSYWHNTPTGNYQICFYPMEQTLRDPDTYSQQVMVWNPDRTIVYDRYFNTDEIWWCGVETEEKMLEWVGKVINGMEGYDGICNQE